MNLISKEQAKEQGLIYYYTGKLCKWGHDSERLVKGGACRECKKIHATSFRNENREEYNRYSRERMKRLYTTEKRREYYRKNIVAEMFSGAKQRAKNKNLSFTISLEDVIIPERCPVFDTEFDFNSKLNVPTLDRVVNELGYIKGNVQVISAKANRLKNNSTIEELEKILNYMKNSITSSTT